MKTISYLRVSTIDQDIEKNKMAILSYANDKHLGHVEFIEEKISGKVPWQKRKVAAIIDELQSGDNIIVSELSRLGRSLVDVLGIFQIILEKKIILHSLKEHFILDDSMQSKVISTMIMLMAEIEKDFISMRTKEALAYRQSKGVKLGRPHGTGTSRLDEFRPEIEALLATHSTKKFIAERYNVTQSTLYRWLKKSS
jgi:DNA invertase Pin-like site-specific DNA recombinase